MTGLIAKLVVYGLKKSIRKRAKVSAQGVSGSVGLIICALPFIVAIFIGIFAYLAIQDPDPHDKMAGYVAVVLLACMLLLMIHYLSYRIVVTNKSIYSHSLILGDRMINFEESFTLEYDEQLQELTLWQRRVKIKIGWTLNGFEDLFRLIVEAHQNRNRLDERDRSRGWNDMIF